MSVHSVLKHYLPLTSVTCTFLVFLFSLQLLFLSFLCRLILLSIADEVFAIQRLPCRTFSLLFGISPGQFVPLSIGFCRQMMAKWSSSEPFLSWAPDLPAFSHLQCPRLSLHSSPSWDFLHIHRVTAWQHCPYSVVNQKSEHHLWCLHYFPSLSSRPFTSPDRVIPWVTTSPSLKYLPTTVIWTTMVISAQLSKCHRNVIDTQSLERVAFIKLPRTAILRFCLYAALRSVPCSSKGRAPTFLPQMYVTLWKAGLCHSCGHFLPVLQQTASQTESFSKLRSQAHLKSVSQLPV